MVGPGNVIGGRVKVPAFKEFRISQKIPIYIYHNVRWPHILRRKLKLSERRERDKDGEVGVGE